MQRSGNKLTFVSPHQGTIGPLHVGTGFPPLLPFPFVAYGARRMQFESGAAVDEVLRFLNTHGVMVFPDERGDGWKVRELAATGMWASSSPAAPPCSPPDPRASHAVRGLGP